MNVQHLITVDGDVFEKKTRALTGTVVKNEKANFFMGAPHYTAIDGQIEDFRFLPTASFLQSQIDCLVAKKA